MHWDSTDLIETTTINKLLGCFYGVPESVPNVGTILFSGSFCSAHHFGMSLSPEVLSAPWTHIHPTDKLQDTVKRLARLSTWALPTRLPPCPLISLPFTTGAPFQLPRRPVGGHWLARDGSSSVFVSRACT